MAATNEFSRLVDRRRISAQPLLLEASEAERAALARRFGLVSIARLEARLDLAGDGDAIDAAGRLRAAIVQSCAVTGEDLPVEIDETIALRFVPDTADHRPDEEIELESDELDEIAFAGDAFDVGEAVAQSLALAIDPYAEGPDADAARKAAGLLDETAAGPFGALAALRGKQE